MEQQKIIRGKGSQQYAYLAGIIDGEGTIGIYYSVKRNIYRLRMSVVNTNEELIRWIQNNFKGYVYSRQYKNWKRKWEWYSKDNIDEILKRILPFLIIKKENAKLAIEFRKTFQKHGHNLTLSQKEIRKKLWVEMKKINTRGV